MASSPDPEVSALISVRQAIDLLDAEPVSPRIERMPLGKARGLRLATDLLSDRDYPPFDKSLMDGYAVRAADVQQTPAELPVVGEVAAGMPPPRGINRGETMAVMTGAPLPPGTEAVVPVEQTEELSSPTDFRGRVRISKSVSANYAVARRGSDMMARQVVLPAGTVLEAPAIAVAASIGAAEVEAFARPRVAILGTGDELVALDQTPLDWQIRNSNNAMLAALLERLGCEVTDLGIARDDPQVIRDAIANAGDAGDALFVTGGMSMGEYDFVPQVLADLGYDLKITKVRMKPGKPFVFASRSTSSDNASGAGNSGSAPRYVFGLPGNPVAAFVCTLRLASRLLARIAGGVPQERWLLGRLEVGLPANGPREFYQPVIRRPATGMKSTHNELPPVEVLAWRGSADVFTLARANGLLVREENEPPVPKGTMVRVLAI